MSIRDFIMSRKVQKQPEVVDYTRLLRHLPRINKGDLVEHYYDKRDTAGIEEFKTVIPLTPQELHHLERFAGGASTERDIHVVGSILTRELIYVMQHFYKDKQGLLLFFPVERFTHQGEVSQGMYLFLEDNKLHLECSYKHYTIKSELPDDTEEKTDEKLQYKR